MRAPLLLIVLLLVAATAGPALARNHGMAGGRADAARHAAMMDHWSNMSAQARERGLMHAEAGGHFARFNYTSGTATGRFASFRLDEANGTVRDYAVRSNNTTTTVFASVVPTPFHANGSAQVRGSILVLDGNETAFVAHNNPLGMLRWHAGDAGLNATFTLASGANVTVNGTQATVTLGALHGHVLANGNGTLAMGAGNATLHATVGPGGTLLFMAHTDKAPANLHAMKDAMASGRVGAMSTIVDADGEPMEESVFLGVRTHARNVGRGHANVTLSSDEHEGRAVVLHFDRAILAPENASRVNASLDGQPMRRASDAGEVLNRSGAGTASFFTVQTPSGVQVIVNVPGFSDHELSLATTGTTTGTDGGTTTTSPPTGTTTSTPPADANDAPGFGVLALLAAVAVALVALRRR